MSSTLGSRKRGRRSSRSSSSSARVSSANVRPYLGSLDRFSKPEQLILQAAAETLHVTVEKLIAGAAAESNSGDNFEATDSPFSDEQDPQTTSGATGDSFDSFAPQPLSGPTLTPTQPGVSTHLRNDSLVGASLDIDAEALMANQPLGSGMDNLFNLDELHSTDSNGAMLDEATQTFLGTTFPEPYMDVLSATGLVAPTQSHLPLATSTSQHTRWTPPTVDVAQSNYPHHRGISLANQATIQNHESIFGHEISAPHLSPLPVPHMFNFATGITQGIEAQQSQVPRHEQASPPTNPAKRARRGRGPYEDREKRKQTELTRRTGACITCSLNRVRVSSMHPRAKSLHFILRYDPKECGLSKYQYNDVLKYNGVRKRRRFCGTSPLHSSEGSHYRWNGEIWLSTVS
jgi:hypothetical protein